MKKRILLLLSLIFSLAATGFAQQAKTVTNIDLEKFRAARLEAERDYAENYEKLGFPSPQELKKQIEEDGRRLRELSARLRAERLEREKTEAFADQINLLETQNEIVQSQNNRPVVRNNYYYGGAAGTPYLYPSYGFYNYRYRNNRSNYDRRRRYWRSNSIPPIRPPK